MPESAVTLRRKAEEAVAAERFSEAAVLFRKEAAIYRANGDVNGAKVEEMKADQYSSELKLYRHLPDAKPPAAALPKTGELAKWEPPYGCYLGGFIDRDERLGAVFTDENSQMHRDPASFNEMTGKKHASMFCYVSYGKRFPTRWAARLRGQTCAAHIAWEPNGGLDIVQDDDYLRTFAQDAARTRCPIFLRFASEMNGDWTRYGGNPARYIEKWRLVKSVMDRYAPNVAMVWCVNAIPEPPIASFYPGDEYVDWVGVNFYSVPFHDNNRARSALAENPSDSIKYVYKLYAAKKPVMICEYGASHRASLDNVDRSPWAGRKIAELYAALPRLYPRVKCIDIFDNDNLKYAQAGRQLNDYSVTDSPQVLEAYKKSIAPDYFLPSVWGAWGGLPLTPPTNTVIAPMPEDGSAPRGILRVSAWARTYAETFTVAYKLNGKLIASVPESGAREADLPLEKPGKYTLEAILLDNKGRVATRTDTVIKVL